MAVISNWSASDISSLWSYACDKKQLKSPSQHNTSIVGHVEASDLVIAHASDSRVWKFTTTHIGRKLVACYELVNLVGVLRVDGVYNILELTEGMIYDVEIVVKLLNNIDIEEVSCSFADTKGRQQQFCTKNLKHLPKNENISITVGQFVAHKAIFSYNQIKFSMVSKDHEHRKHGLIVIGALVVPKH